MKIRREADMGVQVMVGLARLKKPAKAADLLPAANYAARAETLLRLIRAGLVEKQPGQVYALARNCGKITLLDIIEASQGELKLGWNAPAGEDGWLDAIYEDASETLRKRLRKVTLRSLRQIETSRTR